MTERLGRQDFGALAGERTQDDIEGPTGSTDRMSNEGLRDDAGDRADSVEPVDDLIGSTECLEPGDLRGWESTTTSSADTRRH